MLTLGHKHNNNKRIFQYIKHAYDIGDSRYTDINEVFSSEEMGRISRMKISRMQLSSNSPEILLESISTLKRSIAKEAVKKTDTIDSLNEILNRKRNN